MANDIAEFSAHFLPNPPWRRSAATLKLQAMKRNGERRGHG
jgi:hypothetical protein